MYAEISSPAPTFQVREYWSDPDPSWETLDWKQIALE
jgi:hypothetical protein